MSNSPKPAPHFPIVRRLWKPAVVTGVGGTAVVVLLDEIVMFGEEILALIFLPIMAGLIFLLDIFIFKSRLPRRKDFQDSVTKENRK